MPSLCLTLLAGAAALVSGASNLRAKNANADPFVLIKDAAQSGDISGLPLREMAMATSNGSIIKQIHLSLNDNSPAEMVVNCVTFKNVSGISVAWAEGTGTSSYADATSNTYSVGTGWNGLVWTAVMHTLQPATTYSYYLTSSGENPEVAGPFQFTTSRPSISVGATVDFLADHGLFMPFGFAVTDAILANPVQSSLVLLGGDVSYAYLGNRSTTEYESIWDLYADYNQKVTSIRPFVVTVGNHEAFGNFSAVKTRYTSPSGPGGEPLFWYSFDYQGVHFVSMSSEHPYTPGSPQMDFLERDLQMACSPERLAVVPWVILIVHRPPYSTEKGSYSEHIPGAPLTVAVESLTGKYPVPLVLTGHMHSFERTHAVVNGTVVTMSQNNSQGVPTYTNPSGPIYVVQGTSGALQLDTWETQPAWSANRILGTYGYGRLEVHNASALSYKFLDAKNNIVDQFAISRQF